MIHDCSWILNFVILYFSHGDIGSTLYISCFWKCIAQCAVDANRSLLRSVIAYCIYGSPSGILEIALSNGHSCHWHCTVPNLDSRQVRVVPFGNSQHKLARVHTGQGSSASALNCRTRKIWLRPHEGPWSNSLAARRSTSQRSGNFSSLLWINVEPW
jgi:hypothetical protein